MSIDQTRAWRPTQIRRGWRRKLYERSLAIELPRRFAWFATDRGIVRYEIPEPHRHRLERAALRYRGSLIGAL